MSIILLSPDLAGHLAVALRVYRGALAKRGAAEHPALAELEQAALEVVRSNQQASASLTVVAPPDDVPHEQREFLSRTDVHHLTGASLATIDRWIATDQLPSTRHGRIRRIARADLDTFLKAAA